jgi:hypothetical protein
MRNSLLRRCRRRLLGGTAKRTDRPAAAGMKAEGRWMWGVAVGWGRRRPAAGKRQTRRPPPPGDDVNRRRERREGRETEGWAASGVLPALRLWRRWAAAWLSQTVKAGGRRRAEGRRRGWRGGRRAGRGTERGSARRAARSAPPSPVSATWLAGFETKPARI